MLKKNKLLKLVFRFKKKIKQIARSKFNNKDNKRKTLIIKIATYPFIIFLLVFSTLTLLKDSSPSTNPLNLSSLTSIFFYLIILTFILLILKRNKIKTASVLLVSFLYLVTIKTSLIPDINFALIIVFFIFIILLSNILIGSLSCFITSAVSVASIVAMSLFKPDGFIKVGCGINNQYWNTINISALLLFFLLISTLLYLEKKEMKKALNKARESERELLLERESLEDKIKKRTEELNKSQLQEIANFRQLADFGRLSAGLFHELANPLTALNLNMEQINRECRKNETWEKLGNNIERSTKAARKMGTFLKGVKKQLTHQEEMINFSLNSEIEEVLEMIEYKSLRSRVSLNFVADKNYFLNNNSLKFHQIVSCLISNSIDSYQEKDEKEAVIISLKEDKNNIFFSVKDYGCGISLEEQKKIFNPFFSTKNYNKGTGLGLAMVKNIIENNFKGSVIVTSQVNTGSEFLITLPKNI